MNEMFINGTGGERKIYFLKVFVAMPYDAGDQSTRYWSSFFQKAIDPTKEILENKSNFRIEFIHKKRDKKPGHFPYLVEESLDKADILLCVLTEFRPNVMYEVGYARKMKIPIVFLLDQSYQDKQIPILIGKPQTMYYDGREDYLETIRNELWEFIRSACYEAQAKLGQVRRESEPIFNATCYQNRDFLNIPQLIQDANSQIEILTTNVGYFVAPEEADVKHPFEIKDLKDAVKRGVKVRIWTMDPDSNIVVERSKLLEPLAERRDVFLYRKELIKNIKSLYVFFEEEIKHNKFYIGIYDTLPTLMIYKIDKRYFIPSVSLIKRSRYCIHIEFQETDPGVNFTFETALDQVSRIARPVQHFSWIHEDWPKPYELKMPEE